MTPFAEALEEAAERLARKQQEVVDKLINLEDHLGRRLLDSTTLEGESRERRATVLDEFATLWAQYERYRSVAAQIRTVMARPRPRKADQCVAEELMSEADELAAAIERIYDGIHEVVTATDEVWTVTAQRIGACDTLLRQTQTLVENLGLTVSHDPTAIGMAELTGRLNEMRRLSLTDPLWFWVDGAVAVQEADQLLAQCEQAHADLQALAELRQHASCRLDQVGDIITELRGLEEETSVQRRLANAKILTAATDEGAHSADLLGLRLATALQLHRCKHWRQLASELPDLERDVIAARKRAKVELIEAGWPLQQRAELRGRLSAYRAKAAGLGRIEDLALEARYQRARTLLWRAPCDLVAAAAAVAEYLDAVNATATNEDSA
jgi:chaperonin cofactor prefoldin